MLRDMLLFRRRWVDAGVSRGRDVVRCVVIGFVEGGVKQAELGGVSEGSGYLLHDISIT